MKGGAQCNCCNQDEGALHQRRELCGGGKICASNMPVLFFTNSCACAVASCSHCMRNTSCLESLRTGKLARLNAAQANACQATTCNPLAEVTMVTMPLQTIWAVNRGGSRWATVKCSLHLRLLCHRKSSRQQMIPPCQSNSLCYREWICLLFFGLASTRTRVDLIQTKPLWNPSWGPFKGATKTEHKFDSFKKLPR